VVTGLVSPSLRGSIHEWRMKSRSQIGRRTPQNLTYDYDGAGNVLAITDRIASLNKVSFGYDDLNLQCCGIT
jgi:YD repeat-containing protein